MTFVVGLMTGATSSLTVVREDVALARLAAEACAEAFRASVPLMQATDKSRVCLVRCVISSPLREFQDPAGIRGAQRLRAAAHYPEGCLCKASTLCGPHS